MPRTMQSLEQRILGYFRTATLGEARLLHKLAGDALKERTDTPPAPAAPKAKAGAKTNSKPAARSKNGGSGKKKATKKGSSAGHSATSAPTSSELPG